MRWEEQPVGQHFIGGLNSFMTLNVYHRGVVVSVIALLRFGSVGCLWVLRCMQSFIGIHGEKAFNRVRTLLGVWVECEIRLPARRSGGTAGESTVRV